MNGDSRPKETDRTDFFTETNWTSIAAARQANSAISQQALEQLCQTYWYPLYAYVRRRGYSAEDAQDITQAFFCEFLEKNLLGQVDRQKGKFRAYLLACLNLFLSNERKYRLAQKRGGGQVPLSFEEMRGEERYQCEPLADETPEYLFDRQWALTVLQQARAHLREDYSKAGKAELFDRLQAYLSREIGAEQYRNEAATLGMTAGAVGVAVHRLRQRFGDMIRNEIARTVAHDDELESEYQYIQAILARSPDTSFTLR